MENKDEIIVSVYCLAYNHEKYIKSALEGFVNQITNFRYEVIIHDDASTDGTAAIIREYETKYPDIIKPIYQKENQYSKGISILYSFILPKARGKYIAICEGDDYWTDPHKLQIQFDALETHSECSLCVHRVQCHNEDDTYNLRSIPEKEYRLNQTDILNEKQLLKLYYFTKGGYPFHTSSYFFRKKILFERFDFSRDVGILRKCLINGSVFYYNNSMSVRRLLTVGNFNSRLKSGKSKSMVDFCLSNIDNENNFDIYTNRQYHRYSSFRIIESILQIAVYDTEFAKELIDKYRFTTINCISYPPFRKKIKFFILFFFIKHFPSAYNQYKKQKGLL